MAAATTPLTYNGYVNTIAALAVYNVTTGSNGVTVGVDDPFNTILPQMLNYAELRIQRDLAMWPAHSYGDYTLTLGANLFAIPSDDFVAPQTITLTVGGGRQPLTPVSREFIQNVCGSTASADFATPMFFAPVGSDSVSLGGNNLFLIGPVPDQNYPARVAGLTRLPTLFLQGTPGNAATGMTWISANLPDLLLAASMVFITGYQRNFGAQASDPSMGQSWESQYQTLLKSVVTEEAMKRFAGQAWSPMAPTPIAPRAN